MLSRLPARRAAAAAPLAIQYLFFAWRRGLRAAARFAMSIHLIVFLSLLNFTALFGSKVVVTLYAIELGTTAAGIGVLIALYNAFPLLLSVVAGRVADRLGSFAPMLGGNVGFAAGLLIPALFPVLPALYLSASVIGMSMVFYGITIQNLASSLGTAEQRPKNVSIFGMGMACSMFAGPLVAGFAIDHYGHGRAFLVLAVLSAAGAILWTACRRRVPRSAERAEEQRLSGTTELLRNVALRRTIVTSALIAAGVDLYTFYMPIYGHAIGLSASAIGVVLATYAVASFVVRIVMPALVKRLGEEALLTHSMFIAAATYLLFPLFQNSYVLMLLSFVLGLGLGCGQPLSMMMTYNRSPAGRSGEALGLRFTLVNFTHMAIPLIFGTVGSALGLFAVFFSNSALLAAGGWVGRRMAARRS